MEYTKEQILDLWKRTCEQYSETSDIEKFSDATDYIRILILDDVVQLHILGVENGSFLQIVFKDNISFKTYQLTDEEATSNMTLFDDSLLKARKNYKDKVVETGKARLENIMGSLVLS